ncbi:MAG: hypothetical protein AAGJ08_20045 [Cyanobacteria bacterium P01_H01_bin.35]
MDNYQRPESLSIQEILGRPLEALGWSPLFHFHPSEIDQMPDSLPGVYLIRYRDDPKELKPFSMLYVGRADRCLKSSLTNQYLGKDNESLPVFVEANPSGVYFQYLCCKDCTQVEAYLIVALDYPLCN